MRHKKTRFIWMLLLGLIISFLLDVMLKDFANNPNRSRLMDNISSIFITILIWEGNLRIDFLLNNYFSWTKKAKKRFVLQFFISLLYSFLIIYGSMYSFNKFVCHIPVERQSTFFTNSITLGLLVTIIILSIEIGSQFFKHWKESLLEIEKYKTESIKAQLQSLKTQLNPHFLFNNLSVLTSLVYQDQDKSVDFINQLSKVYRYILDNRNAELVTIKEEMKFMESYFFLLKIRFGENIFFDIQINENDFDKKLPPLTLQILVENAMKHNEISSKLPLTICISSISNKLVICNNLQLKSVYEEGTKTGINNIESRYRFFTDEKIELHSDLNLFCVKIPML